MARAKVIRKQERCYVELPKEFSSTEEVEIFPLRDGYYLLSVPLPAQGESSGARGAAPESGPSAGEIAVLHKLQAIKFGDRTPENVARLLSEPEKAALSRLEKRGWVNVFRGSKYRNGVYNIADEVYPMLKGEGAGPEARDARERDTGPKAGAQPAQKAAQQNQQAPSAAQPASYALLIKQGYLVIRDQKDAKALSEMLKTDMKSGTVVGTKGFDGSFYVVTRDYFSKASKAILDALGEESDAAALSEKCGLDADGVRAILQHLAESGDVIEKRKGRYAAV